MRKIIFILITILLVSLVIGVELNQINKEYRVEGKINESFDWKYVDFDNSESKIRCVYIENYKIMPKCTESIYYEDSLDDATTIIIEDMISEINEIDDYIEPVLVGKGNITLVGGG